MYMKGLSTFHIHINPVSLLNIEYSEDVLPTQIFKYNPREGRYTIPSRQQSNFIHKEISFFISWGYSNIKECVLAW